MDQQALREFSAIIDGLPPDERAFIASLSADEVILLHHGLGASVRNRIRAGRLRGLYAWSCTQLSNPAQHSFEELTWPIVLEVWKTLKPSTG